MISSDDHVSGLECFASVFPLLRATSYLQNQGWIDDQPMGGH
jgi:hypothetical protein